MKYVVTSWMFVIYLLRLNSVLKIIFNSKCCIGELKHIRDNRWRNIAGRYIIEESKVYQATQYVMDN